MKPPNFLMRVGRQGNTLYTIDLGLPKKSIIERILLPLSQEILTAVDKRLQESPSSDIVTCVVLFILLDSMDGQLQFQRDFAARREHNVSAGFRFEATRKTPSNIRNDTWILRLKATWNRGLKSCWMPSTLFVDDCQHGRL
jgi:hypothetical protein